MSLPEPLSAPASEVNLGLVLAAIHRILPFLDEPSRAEDVQAALAKAADWLEAARLAHEEEVGAADLEGETVAIIAAAIAAAVGRSFSVLEVKPAPAHPATWTNAWAIEGRFQHYSSHKVR